MEPEPEEEIRMDWYILKEQSNRERSIAEALEHVDTTNHRLKLLWIGCGKGDFLLERNQDFVSMLSSKNIRHQWQLTEGDHSWPVWRGYLAELAPQLFQ